MTMVRKLVDGLASLRLAVVLMSLLALVCSAATVYESRHGTPAAQQAFYGTPWFAALLALLGANVLLSMTNRWPWKLHQAGFVLAHVGILLVLGGSLVTLQFGLDGTLALAEGEQGDAVALPGRSLRVELADGTRAEIPLTRSGEFWGEEAHRLGPDATLVLTRQQPHVAFHEHLEDAPGGVPAIAYHFEGPSVQRVDGELIAEDAERGQAGFGPLVIAFRRATARTPAATLLALDGRTHAMFVADVDGTLRYAFSSRRGPVVTGVAKVGTPIDTPWMELKLVVDQLRPSVKYARHIAAQQPPARESERRPGVELRMDSRGVKGEPFWIAFGETQPHPWGGIAFGETSAALPFRVTLLDFKSDKYPGSAMAATYESRVRVDDPGEGAFERVVSMNKPLHYRGYTLFQSSFAEGERTVSVFSVSRAPGLPFVYLGTTLLVLGVAWMFYVKPWLAARQGRRALAARLATATALLLVAALPAGAADEDALAALRRLPVQDGGRVKPFDTFARETVRRVTGARAFGGDTVKGLDAVAFVVDASADPETWTKEPLVRVADASLRTFLELPAGQERFSFAQLVGHEPFLRKTEQARQQQDDDPDAKLAPEQQAALRLYGDLALLNAVLGAEAPRVMPAKEGEWLAVASLAKSPDPAHQAAFAAWRQLALAVHAQDAPAERAAVEALRASVAHDTVGVATQERLDREVHLNALKPFRAACLFYLAALLPLFASLALKHRWLARAGLALLFLGFVVQTYGFWLRTVVAERAPVTNMYESIVFAAWGAVGLALLFELRHGARVFAACAAGIAVPFLLIADNVPLFDAAIDPLAPVLRDNFWLTTHVLTITLGYAALFLALAMGHVSLGLVAWGATEARVRTMSGFLYRVLAAGTLLLAAGTLLGGVWASYSWGRFWGWDPKETWALIALLVYLALLHARFVGWLKDTGLAVGAIGGGLAVVMAWYGVNYVLGTGLHSYGFGSGGGNAWVAGWAAAEALFVGFVLARRRPEPTVAAVVAAAH